MARLLLGMSVHWKLRRFSSCLLFSVALLPLLLSQNVSAAITQKRYFAHEAVEDRYGVIAPWYTGQDGQCGARIRIAADTLRRYPWTDLSRGACEVPEYLWSGHWGITNDGAITALEIDDHMNGDRGQIASVALALMPDYYRYSSDPMAIAHATMEAEIVLKYGLTSNKHPWPSFPVSVPVMGKCYGQVDERGMIQLDIAANMGYGILRTYQLTGDTKLFDAAKHWGDVFAQKRDKRQGVSPWGRYANPEAVLSTQQRLIVIEDQTTFNKSTVGIVWILGFLDELIRLGYTGTNNEIVEARDAGRAYIQDVLLPAWAEHDTWGRQFWDGEHARQTPLGTALVAQYMMDNKSIFPNWQADCRNIMTLCLNRVCVRAADDEHGSGGEVYSGAWAGPESSICCERSLLTTSHQMADILARYGVEANSEWGKEMARRMIILMTYDFHETGVAEDGMDGGAIVDGDWFKIAHPRPCKTSLATLAWLPGVLGANRESHIVRASSVVNSVVYGKDKIDYSTFDAPANTLDVLRLAFVPKSISADGQALSSRSDSNANGYMVKKLSNGDCIVTIRHDGLRKMVIEGKDPGEVTDDDGLTFEGDWSVAKDAQDYRGGVRVGSAAGATMSFKFTGNQVRLIGRVGPDGGLADVYLDGTKQLAGIDCWNPTNKRNQQVLYFNSGLANVQHELKVVAKGSGNPRSIGANIYVDSIQHSSATGDSGFGEGGGPTETQRMVFGYSGREDLVDSEGNKWWPGSEFVVRIKLDRDVMSIVDSVRHLDTVSTTWFTDPGGYAISGTSDRILYGYGVHAPEFVVNVTVGPGKYYVRPKFAVTRGIPPKTHCVTILINGREVVSKMDIAATAGDTNKAVDLVFNDITPRNGVIDVRFIGGDRAAGKPGEALLQALEVGPGKCAIDGAKPVCVSE